MADDGPRYLLPFDTFRLPHHLTPPLADVFQDARDLEAAQPLNETGE